MEDVTLPSGYFPFYLRRQQSVQDYSTVIFLICSLPCCFSGTLSSSSPGNTERLCNHAYIWLWLLQSVSRYYSEHNMYSTIYGLGFFTSIVFSYATFLISCVLPLLQLICDVAGVWRLFCSSSPNLQSHFSVKNMWKYSQVCTSSIKKSLHSSKN